VDRIRVVVGKGRGVLRGIIMNTLGSEPDMIVRELGDGDDTAAAASTYAADVVILTGDAEPLAAEWLRVLYACPRACVLSVVDDGRSATVHELRPRSAPVDDVSPRGLVAAVRSAVAESLAQAGPR
jgi:hypothetical protein